MTNLEPGTDANRPALPRVVESGELRLADVVSGTARRPVRSLAVKQVPVAPDDPILELAERVAAAQKHDSRIINCVLGEYQTEETQAVAAARRLINPADHRYGPMRGYQRLSHLTSELLFDGSAAFAEGRVASVITAGGTGANFLLALTLKREPTLGFQESTVHVTDPTWGNHLKVWGKDAGYKIDKLPYYNAQTHMLRTDELLGKLSTGIPPRSVILLHASCHNPTGQDPTPAEWHEIATLIHDGGHLLVLDMAYLGYDGEVADDVKTLHMMANEGLSFYVCFSFSKFMGLYGERTGAVVYVGDSEENTAAVASQLGDVQRGMISNPPIHGQKLAVAILSDPDGLRTDLYRENRNIRAAMLETRERISEGMKRRGYEGLGHITKQKGLFSPLPLDIDHLLLREDPNFPMFTAGQRLVFNHALQERVDDACDAMYRAYQRGLLLRK